MASDTRPPNKTREKVALQPGFHLVDWMRLSNSSISLSGRKPGEPLRKITPTELAEHSSEFDCWTAYNGKVYNITQYAAYHPGGIKKLMLGAGKDCTDLFNKYHKWVNIDSIMAKCVVGILMVDQKTICEEDEEDDSNIETQECAEKSDIVNDMTDTLKDCKLEEKK